MQKEIHPIYFPKAAVACACGKTFTVGSTREKIEVEICASCHPFFTGADKVMDAAGRVDKFKKRATKAVARLAKKAKAQKEAASEEVAD